MKKLFLSVPLILICFFIFSETADDYYKKADEYRTKKQYEKAIEYYTKTIQTDPQYYRAYYNRGRCYYEKKMYDEAITNFDMTIKINPEYSNAYYRRGIVYRVKKTYNKAIENFNKAINLNSKFHEAYYELGLVYYEKGEFETSLKNYNISKDLNPKNENVYRRIGLAYLQKNDYKSSIDNFNKAINIKSNSSFYYGRSIAYYCNGTYNKAIVDMEIFIKKSPEFSFGYALYVVFSSKISESKYKNTLDELLKNKNLFKDKGLDYLIAQYLMEKITENDLIKNAGNDKHLLGEAYYFISFKNRINGKIDAAKNYLLKSIEINDDPTCPCIPLAKEDIKSIK